jgi:hypothetical protein
LLATATKWFSATAAPTRAVAAKIDEKSIMIGCVEKRLARLGMKIRKK